MQLKIFSILYQDTFNFALSDFTGISIVHQLTLGEPFSYLLFHRYDDPDSGTSSFSMLLGDAPHLDGKVCWSKS